MGPTFALILGATDGFTSLVSVAIGAAFVGLPALLYSIWRGRSMGPKEEDDLVSRTAKQTIEAMGDVLAATHAERDAMVSRIRLLEGDNAIQAARIITLERELQAAQASG